ncbi:MAG TPA: DUF58 domain-containing protein, partial [Candidatus Acidoferrum sp.]|nr:DUF58 domain-containing protein [Candidatus Acidoferrum sp.]
KPSKNCPCRRESYVTLLYKPIYWIYRVSSGLWYWSRRRFTRAGLCVAGGILVAAAVSTDVENTVTYQSFALLLAFLLPALAGNLFFRATFSAARLLPRFGTVGQPLHYRVLIKNLTGKTQAGLTLLEDLADPRPVFRQWLAFQLAETRRVRPFSLTQPRRKNPFRPASLKEAEVPPLPAGGEGVAPVEVLPLRRGILRFTGVTLARPDPLGLFRSFVKISAPQTVLILPRRYAIPPIALPGAFRYQEGGVALAANVGRSEEFVALREYRHGDPLRHIHWRSWAKAGKPIVKEFEDEFFVRHALVLDTFDDEPNSEILEEAVSVAASFACTVLTQESLLDLLFVGNQSYCFTAGRGLAHVDQMLEILASVKNCADKEFAALEHLVLNHIAAVSGCICVLQRWDKARTHLVKTLRALGIPLLVLVVVRAGENKPEAGPMGDDPENFHVLEIGQIAQQLEELQ